MKKMQEDDMVAVAVGALDGENENTMMTVPPSLLTTLLLSSLELSDTKVYEPQIRALLGTASRFCEVVVLKVPSSPNPAP